MKKRVIIPMMLAFVLVLPIFAFANDCDIETDVNPAQYFADHVLRPLADGHAEIAKCFFENYCLHVPKFLFGNHDGKWCLKFIDQDLSPIMAAFSQEKISDSSWVIPINDSLVAVFVRLPDKSYILQILMDDSQENPAPKWTLDSSLVWRSYYGKWPDSIPKKVRQDHLMLIKVMQAEKWAKMNLESQQQPSGPDSVMAYLSSEFDLPSKSFDLSDMTLSNADYLHQVKYLAPPKFGFHQISKTDLMVSNWDISGWKFMYFQKSGTIHAVPSAGVFNNYSEEKRNALRLVMMSM
jgi:hypothetical protein